MLPTMSFSPEAPASLAAICALRPSGYLFGQTPEKNAARALKSPDKIEPILANFAQNNTGGTRWITNARSDIE